MCPTRITAGSPGGAIRASCPFPKRASRTARTSLARQDARSAARAPPQARGQPRPGQRRAFTAPVTSPLSGADGSIMDSGNRGSKAPRRPERASVLGHQNSTPKKQPADPAGAGRAANGRDLLGREPVNVVCVRYHGRGLGWSSVIVVVMAFTSSGSVTASSKLTCRLRASTRLSACARGAAASQPLRHAPAPASLSRGGVHRAR
jgi:hypothetical protein